MDLPPFSEESNGYNFLFHWQHLFSTWIKFYGDWPTLSVVLISMSMAIWHCLCTELYVLPFFFWGWCWLGTCRWLPQINADQWMLYPGYLPISTSCCGIRDHQGSCVTRDIDSGLLITWLHWKLTSTINIDPAISSGEADISGSLLGQKVGTVREGIQGGGHRKRGIQGGGNKSPVPETSPEGFLGALGGDFIFNVGWNIIMLDS